MNTLRTIFLIVASLLLVGCVLPIPHRRLHAEGIEATVINARTSSPVTEAKILSLDDSSVMAQVDSEGRFKIPAKYGWHGAYLIGPISYSLFPHFDISYPCPPFQIDADGYQSTIISPANELPPNHNDGRIMIPLHPR